MPRGDFSQAAAYRRAHKLGRQYKLFDTRRRVAAAYYKKAEQSGGAEKAYYYTIADQLANVSPRLRNQPLLVLEGEARMNQIPDDGNEGRVKDAEYYKRLFTRLFSMLFLFGRKNDQPDDDSQHARMPLPVHMAIWAIGILIINGMTFGDIGIGLVLVGIAWRELYARMSGKSYNPIVARVLGLLPAGLTLLGTMWQFGLAVVVQLVVWEHLPFVMQEKKDTKEKKKNDDHEEDDEHEHEPDHV